MNTIARKLSIFVLMAAAAATALTIGATTTFAASDAHTHHIQLMGKDDSWASSFTHTPTNLTGTAGSDDGGFNSAQYGWSHPHHQHSSTDMIADFNGDNSNDTAGSDDRGGFSSAQYGSSGSHSHHHLNSGVNSSWMWPTHHSASDIVDLN
jgi:opacity protein-like surface antigen